MPQFILEGRDHAARAESEFVFGFIEAMFFTESGDVDMDSWLETDEEERTQGGQLPSDCGYGELHPDSLAKIRADCEAWQKANAKLLRRAYKRAGYNEAQAGRDYWFTRNGHGVGFWDRAQLESHGLGAALSEAAGRSEVHAFFGGHVTHGEAPFVHVAM